MGGVKRLFGCFGSDPKSLEAIEGTKEESRIRTRSLWIAHCSLFIVSLGFSIVLTGVFAYMKQLLPTTVEENKTDEVEFMYIV